VLYLCRLLLRLHLIDGEPGHMTMDQERKPSFKIAFSGVCLAIALILIFGGAMLPGIDMTLFALASILTAIVIIEAGPVTGVLFFVAASILGLIIVPNKVTMLPYICFFGYWGILKYYIERIKKGTLQIICKSAFFAVILYVAFMKFMAFLFPKTDYDFMTSVDISQFPLAVLILAGIAFLLLYDYIFTLILNFYYRRFKGNRSEDLKLS